MWIVLAWAAAITGFVAWLCRGQDKPFGLRDGAAIFAVSVGTLAVWAVPGMLIWG